MKRILKHLMLCSFVLFLVVSLFSIGGFAKENEVEEFDIVKAKQELVEKARLLDNDNKISLSSHEIDRKLTQMVNMGISEEKIAEEMEKYSVYKLEVPEEFKDQVFSIMNDNTNIDMSTPMIYYDNSLSQWIVIGGGAWKTNNWTSYIPTLWPSGATTVDVGGRDGFGVAFTATGTNYNTSVISSYAEISDGRGNERTTTSRSDGDGRLGFGFQIQDQLRRPCTATVCAPNATNFSYVGKHFSGLSRYTSNFTNYSGVATSYYVHTYDKAQLTSVKFGVSGKTAGVDATITNSSQSFTAFSGDKRF